MPWGYAGRLLAAAKRVYSHMDETRDEGRRGALSPASAFAGAPGAFRATRGSGFRQHGWVSSG